jgi:drug/metabolite transporter (DMT)-like permease
MPGIFVLLWSTGFIGAKYGLPYAEPLTFLLYRFIIVLGILLMVAVLMRAPWPRTPVVILHCLVSGVLLHGVYLGGVFGAIGFGMPAGIAALIVGLQPLLTALLSRPLLGEQISKYQWAGVFLGLVGVSLVLAPRILTSGGQALTLLNGSLGIAALLGITFGTIYQKAFVTGQDLRTSGILQFTGGAMVVGVGAFSLETMQVTWTPQFIGAMAWLVIVLSLGAITLLILIIRHGEVSRVATLFYLVPPVTALIAFFMFNEHLDMIQLTGMALTAYAVWLGSRRKR